MSHQFKIHVENDTLILRGSPEESVGCVLRGCVILHTKETMKIKSITLNFSGRMKVLSNDRNHQQRKEYVVVEHNWSFLTSQKKISTLPSNVYKYPFEYVLPGDLAETIDSNSYGSLLYKLKAVVDRPAFLPNLIDRLQLRITRQYTPSYHMSNIPMQISNEWANKIDYKITVPKRIYSRGEQIPIEFSLIPKPNCGLHVRYLSCFLKEYTKLVSGSTNAHTESRIIRFFRDETFPSTGLHWHKTEIMSVPHSLNSIQCDLHNQYFRVEHKLKFTMSLINRQGEISELRASIPVEIVNQRIEVQEEESELPTYENAWRSALYSPLPYLDATSPFSPTDEPFPITPSTTEPGDYFAYRPASSTTAAHCAVLPSYNSVINTPIGDDNYGLPSYE